jgi:hypothetical protein
MPKGLAPITVYRLLTAYSVAANTNVSTQPVDLREVAKNGVFAIKYTVTGDGTVKFEYNVCEKDDGTFIEPSGASDIASSITKTSGTSGVDVVSFEPEIAPFMKIKVTETGTSNAAVVTLDLFIQ